MLALCFNTLVQMWTQDLCLNPPWRSWHEAGTYKPVFTKGLGKTERKNKLCYLPTSYDSIGLLFEIHGFWLNLTPGLPLYRESEPKQLPSLKSKSVRGMPRDRQVPSPVSRLPRAFLPGFSYLRIWLLSYIVHTRNDHCSENYLPSHHTCTLRYLCNLQPL